MLCKVCGETDETKFKPGSTVKCHKCRLDQRNYNFKHDVNGLKTKQKIYKVENKIPLKRAAVAKYRDSEAIRHDEREAIKAEKRRARELRQAERGLK